MEENKNAIWDYLDGEMPAEKQAAFEEWLEEDRGHLSELVRQAALDRGMRTILLQETATTDFVKADHSSEDVLQTLMDWDQTAKASSARRVGRPESRSPFLFLAACLGAVTATAIFWGSGHLRWEQSAESAIAQINEPVTEAEPSSDSSRSQDIAAATVTGLVDAVWKQGTYHAKYGEFLGQGQELHLVEGLVQLSFDSGAKLLLQAPARFRIESSMSSTLDSGKLAATCPPQSYGFVIRTPSAEVIDLGTEFAIDVKENGTSEVHVIDGELVSRPVDQLGRFAGKPVNLTSRQAMLFSSVDRTVQEVSFNAAKFVRELEPRLTVEQRPQLPVLENLAIWLAADTLVKLDEENRVVAWHDLLAGDNQIADDALQFYPETRPLWIEKGINDRPALRFMGNEYLVTTPSTSAPDQTVAIAFKLGEEAFASSRTGGQILNYNGPPLNFARRSLEGGVLQIGDGRQGPKERVLGKFSARVWELDKKVRSGFVTAKPLNQDEITILTYVYNFTEGEARLYLNGELQGTSKADVSSLLTSRKIIGRHASYVDESFIGDIAELLIYDKALDDGRRESLERYLLDRYLHSRPSANSI